MLAWLGLLACVQVPARVQLALPPTRERRLGQGPMQSRPPTLRRMAMLPLVRLFQMPVHRLLAQRHPPESPD